MRLDLIPHPDHPTDIVRSVEVAVHRGQAGGLVLTFGLTGDMSQIRLPPIQAAGRADDLWQATCFEAFIHSGGGGSYLEFNFSPSSQWAAYRFDGYRLGMARLDLPGISAVGRGEAGFCGLVATIELDSCAGLAFDRPWRMGFSAIIEETGGHKSFWALAHPPGKPDFHHPVAFACDVPTVVQW